jgi:RNA-directed DNA polymerase
MSSTKSFAIPKRAVFEAWKRVKANRGGAGIDRESLTAFEKNLKGNLYKIWNRMVSGSYFPPPVRQVGIPKKDGRIRYLGIPTVADRVAQTVVKMVLEPQLELHFDPDSYGYRPGKSAKDAVAATRERCWKYDWVVEFDIKGAFDNLDHDLMMKALRTHTDCRWILLYVERWLQAPVVTADGEVQARRRGTFCIGRRLSRLAAMPPHAIDHFQRCEADTGFDRGFRSLPLWQLWRRLLEQMQPAVTLPFSLAYLQELGPSANAARRLLARKHHQRMSINSLHIN